MKVRDDNQYCFIPFDFDPFEFLASQLVDFFIRLQIIIDNNVMCMGSNEFMFKRISFVSENKWHHNLLHACS